MKEYFALLDCVQGADGRFFLYFCISDNKFGAATRIEDSFGNGEAFEANEATAEETDTDRPQEAVIKAFEPYKGKERKSGTGGIYEINDHLFEGRYTPTNAHGKREAHNVYAKTKDKCVELLEEMIAQVRAQIAEEKAAIKAVAESAEGQ